MGIFDQLAGINQRQMQIAADASPQLTPAQAAYFGTTLAPGAATIDASGNLPPPPPDNITVAQLPEYLRTTAPMPSFAENVRQGNLLDAFFQGIGQAGDAIPVLGASVGLPARAVRNAIQAARRSNVPEDVPPLTFTSESAPPPRDAGTARTIQTTGKYRGAPAGMNNQQKLGRMQLRLRNYLSDGAPYRMWYENTNDWARSQTGNRKGRMDQYGGTVAVTSSDTAVPQNAAFAMKAYNQGIVGDEIRSGRYPTAMGKKITEIFGGETGALGPKRDPFFDAIIQNPERLRQTNDIRMARAFGYSEPDGTRWTSGLSAAQHRFMDEETQKLLDYAKENKIGGTDDWNLDRVQAAIWIAQKAEEDGSSIADAARMFQDFTPSATIRTEAAPSASLDHLSGLLDPELRPALEQFSQMQDAAMQTPNLRDFPTLQSGAMTDATFQGPGVYEGMSNPAYGIPVSIGKQPQEGFAPGYASGDVIDDASRKLIEANAAFQGVMRGQDTVGYTAILPAKRVTSRNALQVDLGRQVSREEIIELERQMNDEFGSGTMLPLVSPNGLDIIVADDTVAAKLNSVKKGQTPAWQKTLTGIVNKNFEKPKTKWGLNSGGLVGDTEQWRYRPSQYLPALESVGPEMQNLLEKAAKGVGPKLDDVDRTLLRAVPELGNREQTLVLARQAFSEGGVPRLRQLVDQGVLPAAVLGLLGFQQVTLPNRNQRDGQGLQ